MTAPVENKDEHENNVETENQKEDLQDGRDQEQSPKQSVSIADVTPHSRSWNEVQQQEPCTADAISRADGACAILDDDGSSQSSGRLEQVLASYAAPASPNPYRPPSAGSARPTSAGRARPTSAGRVRPTSAGCGRPLSAGRARPTSAGRGRPTTSSFAEASWDGAGIPATNVAVSWESARGIAGVAQLEGVWLSTSGEWQNVALGVINEERQLRVVSGSVVCDGWMAVEIDQEHVVWQMGDQSFEWLRPSPQALNGPWKSAPDGWRNVVEGWLGNMAIILEDGVLRMGDWRAIVITKRSVTWESAGQTSIWYRPTPEHVSGPWLSEAQKHLEWRNVVRGTINGQPLQSFRGGLLFGGWYAAHITEETVMWCRSGEAARWVRPTPDDLAGPWRRERQGGWLNVRAEGRFEQGSITLRDGRLTQNGWIASFLSATAAVWERFGTEDIWVRPTVPSLNGPWRGSDGSWYNIVNGVLYGDKHGLVEEEGRLTHADDWEATEITGWEVTWQRRGASVAPRTWRRPGPEDLEGPWLTAPSALGVQQSGGFKSLWRNIRQGRLLLGDECATERQLDENDEVVFDNEGRLRCGIWLVTFVTDTEVRWESPDEEVRWVRPGLDSIDGPWINLEGRLRNVTGGQLPDASLTLEDGRLALLGFQLTVATSERITWEKEGCSSLAWRRPRPLDLDGPWLSVEDGWRKVVEGEICGIPIERSRTGSLTFNGWVLTAMTQLSLKWEKGGTVVEWHRPWRDPKDTPVGAAANAALVHRRGGPTAIPSPWAHTESTPVSRQLPPQPQPPPQSPKTQQRARPQTVGRGGRQAPIAVANRGSARIAVQRSQRPQR
eukprot:TRINITY_DN26424_c0_g2_i1.p1 TRINITY_DN26424_c0_g2~~TRINITY_DN26424_c0_g2_i1.p1  ORF type:complete len:838 (-),score=120.45 TRINITY_DN26424_c0_g2_i1:105-2618(-)